MRGKRTSGCLAGSPHPLSETKSYFSLPQPTSLSRQSSWTRQALVEASHQTRMTTERTGVSTLALGFVSELDPSPTVHDSWLFDD